MFLWFKCAAHDDNESLSVDSSTRSIFDIASVFHRLAVDRALLESVGLTVKSSVETNPLAELDLQSLQSLGQKLLQSNFSRSVM